MNSRQSRRKFLRAALASAAGIGLIEAAASIADRYGLLAPDHGGVLGMGEALTYGSQRLPVAQHSMAREFSRSDISPVSPVNHAHPRFDPYVRLLSRNFTDWRLYVDGAVAKPRAFCLADLRALPARTQITHLICEEG